MLLGYHSEGVGWGLISRKKPRYTSQLNGVKISDFSPGVITADSK